MIKKEIMRPSGKNYLTIWLEEETNSIKIKLADSGYTVKIDQRVASEMYNFFKELHFYKFCERKK